GNAHDRHAMVLVVVGEKGERAVGVDDRRTEHGRVPADQLLAPRRAAPAGRERARRHATALRGKTAPAIVLDAHLRAPPGLRPTATSRAWASPTPACASGASNARQPTWPSGPTSTAPSPSIP